MTKDICCCCGQEGYHVYCQSHVKVGTGWDWKMEPLCTDCMKFGSTYEQAQYQYHSKIEEMVRRGAHLLRLLKHKVNLSR